jgi:hypothetical protein
MRIRIQPSVVRGDELVVNRLYEMVVYDEIKLASSLKLGGAALAGVNL